MNALPELPEALWTVGDLAKYAKCSPSWIYKAVERGELPHLRLGALIRFDPREVVRFVTSRQVAVQRAVTS